MEEAPSRKTSPAVRQPRPQGRLVFQYDGGRREDPGTQQRSRDQFVHGEKILFKMAAPLLSPKWEPLQTVSAAYFILGISRTDL